jgi:hypothetical protein
MKQTNNFTDVKFISIVDSQTAPLSLFQNLYSLKEENVIQEIASFDENQIFTVNRYHDFRTPANVIYKRPTSEDFELRRFTSYNEDASVSIPDLINPIETRTIAGGRNRNCLTYNLIRLYNHNKYFNYNLNTHNKLIEEHQFTPLILNKESIFFNLPRWLSDSNNINNRSEFLNFKNWVESLDFVYWKQPEFVYSVDSGPFSDKTIYSFMSPELFKAFDGNYLNVDSNGNIVPINHVFDLHSMSSDRSQNRGYWRNRNNNYNLDTSSRSMCINTCKFGDISYLQDCTYTVNTLNEATNESAVETVDFNTHFILNVFPKKRIKVIKVPSWKTKSNDNEIEFSSYTKNQFLKRNTSFASLIVHYPSYGSNLEKINVNYFNLVSNADYRDIPVRSRINERLNSLFKLLTWKGGIKLTNPEQAQSIVNSLLKGLNRYSNKLIEEIPEETIANLVNIKNQFNELTKEQNCSLTLSPKVDESLSSKYNKLHLNITENLNNIKYNTTFYQNLVSRSQEMQRYTNLFKEAKRNLNKVIEENCEIIRGIYSSAEYLNRNQKIYNSISNKYHQAYEASLLSNNYNTDNFFQNLSESHIKILNIKYDSSKNKMKIVKASSSQEEFIDFIKAKNSDHHFKIKTVEFLIDTPSKIKVDSNDSKIHAGGPYLVKADENSIYIKLAYNYSLFGKESGSNIYCTHPHTGTNYELMNLFTDWSRGCLGEATSLLYNAFDKNDLKLIVLACLTWVNSANSSDPWGRKYDWFVKYSELSDALDLQPHEVDNDLQEEDVGEFLQELFEHQEEEEEEEETPEQQPDQNLNRPENPQQVWNPNDFTNSPETYTPFTQR